MSPFPLYLIFHIIHYLTLCHTTFGRNFVLARYLTGLEQSKTRVLRKLRQSNVV